MPVEPLIAPKRNRPVDLPMNVLAVALAPLALILPPVASVLPDVGQARVPTAESAEGKVAGLPVSTFDLPQALRVLDTFIAGNPAGQVRIEQRVIIRISPGAAGTREQSMAALPRRPLRQQFQEQRYKDCIPISTIVGVEPGPNNRLMLFMSDRRILTAELEKSCNARDFYSGLYIERSEDGRLCSGRDELQSRAGASCGVEHLNRLTAVRD